MGMKTFLFTVPQKYRTGPHPVQDDLGPDDLFAVTANNEIYARLAVIDSVANDSWCSVLAKSDPETDQVIAKYFPGRIVEFEPCDMLRTYGTHALPEADGTCIGCDKTLTEADVLATASDLGYGPVDPVRQSSEPF